jgi:AbiV family abortive infection protein
MDRGRCDGGSKVAMSLKIPTVLHVPWTSGAQDCPMNRSKTFDSSVDAIVTHARRLLEDAEMLKYADPPTTAFFLVRIAQEELAKAFLLCLVSRRIIPWHRHILHATQDHTSKQLVAIVMDHLNPADEHFLARVHAFSAGQEVPRMPRKVADAIYILRHEKIGRWVSSSWVWAEAPEYDQEAVDVAEGRRDKHKQDALYVRLGASGSVVSSPQTLPSVSIDTEMDRARRFCCLVEGVRNGQRAPGVDWTEVEEMFRFLFSDAYPE